MKVRYIHSRFVYDGVVDNLGGTTVAYRLNDSGLIEYGIAYCSPFENYNKKFGRNKATGRLNSETLRKVSDLSLEDFVRSFV